MPSVKSGQIKFVCAEVFRDGIKPEWEDKMNQNGGHFQFQLKNTISPGQIDESQRLSSCCSALLSPPSIQIFSIFYRKKIGRDILLAGQR